jgi:5-methylcytosine-specific restriction endonuclease McrA
MSSNSKRKAIEKRLDTLSSELCKLLAQKSCYTCGREGTDAHHVIGRDHRRQRWNQDNLVCLCRKHHDQAAKEHWDFGKNLSVLFKIWHLSELEELEIEIKLKIKELI